MDETEARAALATMQDAKDRLAAAADCPPWRHAAFGAVMAALVLGVAVPEPWFAPTFVTAMAATVWLVRSDRMRNGLFLNGYRRGRTLPVTVGLLVAQGALMFLAMPARNLPFPSLRGLACVAAASVVATVASVLFQRIYLAELRGTRA